MNEFNNEKEKGKNVYKILFIVVFVLLIVLIGYLTFTRVLDSKKLFGKEETKEVQEQKENDKKEDTKKELDINSGKVLNLYNLVKPYQYYWDFKDNKEETVLVSEIPYENLFQFAMANQSFGTTIDCNDIKEEFKNKYKNSYDNVTCGDNEYKVETDSFNNYNGYASTNTDFYKEEDIKKLFHQIYGSDYYQRKEIVSSLGIEYFYIEAKKGYAIMKVPTGGFGPMYEGKIVSASQKDNELYINEDVKITDSTDNKEEYYNFKYTFKYNQDDASYYFYSLTKTKK